jgi:hypothetical protein
VKGEKEKKGKQSFGTYEYSNTSPICEAARQIFGWGKNRNKTS